MQQLRLEDLLRYAFSGALFFITLILSHTKIGNAITRVQGIGEATLVVGLVLLVGSVIYTFHRAILYPLVFFPLTLTILAIFRVLTFDINFLIPVKPSRLEIDLDRWRLRLRVAKHPMDALVAEWGAQVHFLYCSSVAILLALYVSRFLPFAANYRAIKVFEMTSLGLFCGGLIHHLRLIWRIDVERKDTIETTSSENPSTRNSATS